MSANVTVLGSLNMDMVIQVQRRPARGETVLGSDFALIPGGKGLNQAVAAARTGAAVAMIGKVGSDAFGAELKRLMEIEGIDARLVSADAGSTTGVASIYVDGDGDNSIVVAPQANGRLMPADAEACREAIRSAGVLLMQLEVPLQTVEFAAQLAAAAGIPVVLNPAPAPEVGALSKELLSCCHTLIPNQHEASILCGFAVDTVADACRAALAIRSMGPKNVVVTAGADGAVLLSEASAEPVHFPAFPVTAIDTTAAGDTFCGVYASCLAQRGTLVESVRLASAAGALSTTKKGATTSIPTKMEILRLAVSKIVSH